MSDPKPGKLKMPKAVLLPIEHRDIVSTEYDGMYTVSYVDFVNNNSDEVQKNKTHALRIMDRESGFGLNVTKRCDQCESHGTNCRIYKARVRETYRDTGDRCGYCRWAGERAARPR